MKKTVLITGASSGIGRACAIEFGRSGYSVGINYNKNKKGAEELAELLKLNGIDCEIFPCDVSDEASVSKMINDFIGRFGRIDVLINNAGISLNKLLDETTWEDFSRVMGVNVGGVFNCTKATLPFMRKQNGGSIINISSVWGVCGASLESVYSASKAAIIGFTKAMCKELYKSPIRINCIAPGVIETDMLKHLSESDLAALTEQTPIGRLGTPQDVASCALWLCSSASEFITGQIIGVNGGFLV